MRDKYTYAEDATPEPHTRVYTTQIKYVDGSISPLFLHISIYRYIRNRSV